MAVFYFALIALGNYPFAEESLIKQHCEIITETFGEKTVVLVFENVISILFFTIFILRHDSPAIFSDLIFRVEAEKSQILMDCVGIWSNPVSKS